MRPPWPPHLDCVAFGFAQQPCVGPWADDAAATLAAARHTAPCAPRAAAADAADIAALADLVAGTQPTAWDDAAVTRLVRSASTSAWPPLSPAALITLTIHALPLAGSRRAEDALLTAGLAPAVACLTAPAPAPLLAAAVAAAAAAPAATVATVLAPALDAENDGGAGAELVARVARGAREGGASAVLSLSLDAVARSRSHGAHWCDATIAAAHALLDALAGYAVPEPALAAVAAAAACAPPSPRWGRLLLALAAAGGRPGDDRAAALERAAAASGAPVSRAAAAAAGRRRA